MDKSKMWYLRFDGHVFYYENAADPNKMKFNVEPDDVVIENHWMILTGVKKIKVWIKSFQRSSCMILQM